MTDPFGIDELVETLQGTFGDLFGKSSKGRGRDLSMPLRLTLHEAAHGCTREVEVKRTRTCALCSGSGGLPGASFAPCAACEGRGETETTHGALELTNVCESCRGRRGRWNRPCDACDAEGTTPDAPSRVKVSVPPSVRPGQQLRLAGLGERAKPDAKTPDGEPQPAGDLFLGIEIDLPSGLAIEGDHLVAQVRLDADGSRRGGTITVPWIDGTARVVIPAHTSHGTRIVKRGWGLAPLRTPFSPPPDEAAPYRSIDAGARGDLVVVVSHGADPDALLEAELAAMPERRARFGENELRAASIGLVIVAAVFGYLLLSR